MTRQKLALFATILAMTACSKSQVEPKTALSAKSILLSSTQEALATATNSTNSTSYTASGVISLNGAHDITISGKSIQGGTRPAISLTNCYNVHITQNALTNSSDVGIYLYNCKNITVDYNYIANVSTGVYVDHPSGGGTVVANNQMLNMKGPFPRGQFVQFNTVKGSGNKILYNKLQNILGQSSSQEAINIYKSVGTSSSPIEVIGNWIRGGGPNNASGGIQLGDSGGSYQIASGNILVNPGQMGLSISGGDHISFKNNTVYAKAQYFSNVGVVVWGQAGETVVGPTVSGNKVNFKNSGNAQNDNWIASGNPRPAGWDTNIWAANITDAILPANLITSTASSKPLQSADGITQGASSTPDSPTATLTAPIVMSNKSNITIKDLTIAGGNAACIKLTNCNNVYITLCTLKNSSNVAIELNNCTNITIEKNKIYNVAAGIVANNCIGGGISIYTNQMQNMLGQLYGGAFVQFVNVLGSNNNISYNKLQNIAGQSQPQYGIHLISSKGTLESPIMIDGNWMRGGGPGAPSGGICLGDNGGGYQIATNNILVDPGQFGLAIVGGNRISLTNNSVYGKRQSFTNVGLYVWGQSGTQVTNSVVSGNRINFKNSNNIQNDTWLGTGQVAPSGWNSNTTNAAIGDSILPSSIVSF